MKTLALLLLFTGSCAAMEQKVASTPSVAAKSVMQLAFEQMQSHRLSLKAISLRIKEMPAGNNKTEVVLEFAGMVEDFAVKAQENMRDCTVHHIKLVRAYKREIKLALQTLNNL